MAFVTLGTGQHFEVKCRNGTPNDIACSISGVNAPMVDFELKPAQSILCDFDDVRLIGNNIAVRPWPSLSKETRLLVNSSRDTNQQLVLSKSRFGQAGAFDLSRHAGRLLCRTAAFLAAGPGVMAGRYSRHKTNAYGTLEFLFLEGNGWVFAHASGSVLEHRLAPGEKLRINASSLIAMSATIELASCPSQGRRRDDKEVDGRLAQLTGPGTFWLQSCLSAGEANSRQHAKTRKPHLAVVS